MAKTKEGKDIDFKANFKIYVELSKKYKWFFIGAVVAVLFAESFYVLEKYLFKMLIDGATLFTQGDSTGFMATLYLVASIFIGMIILRPFIDWFRMSMINTFESKVIQDVKERFYRHLTYLSHKFHTTHKTGSLISRLLRGGHAVEGFSDVLIFNFAPLLLQIFLAGGALLTVHPTSTITALVMSIVFIIYSFYIQTKLRKLHMSFVTDEDREKAAVADTFTNIDSIKYFGKEAMMQRRYHYFTENTRVSLLRVWNKYRVLSAGQSFILLAGLFFMIFFPMKAFLAGNLTVGELVFVYTIYGSFVGPLFSFVHGLRGFYRSMADFESLFQYNKIDQDVKDIEGAKKIKIEDGAIDFNNVSFTYGKKNLFKNFNLSIKKNEKIALVGHSGCGKSTLVKLLYRLYDVTGGSILVDGKDIRTLKQEELRGELSIVPQEGVLFDDTIYNNIKFARPNAKRKEVIAAMKFAQLYQIVQEFPEKEKTIVGERGVKLSGGEKQRVSIARAILADKKILLLDEATSALDSQTEHDIHQDLEKLMEGRTSIIIAHRLSTIMRADRIIVMKKGKIVQMGKHKNLIKQKGPYKKMWDLQKGGYIA